MLYPEFGQSVLKPAHPCRMSNVILFINVISGVNGNINVIYQSINHPRAWPGTVQVSRSRVNALYY